MGGKKLFYKHFNQYTDIQKLLNYEKKIVLLENGNIALNDHDLIGLADEILDYDSEGCWSVNLSNKYELGCDINKSLEESCAECTKFKEDQCNYARAICLAEYIYRNLVSDLPRDRELVTEYLGLLLLGE